jgi:hypothetical protein
MGKYLNIDLNKNPLHARGKATSLVQSGAERIEEPRTLEQHKGKAVLCVVENGPFDAAAWAYNESELNEFKREDGRPKSWLTVSDSVVESLID